VFDQQKGRFQTCQVKTCQSFWPVREKAARAKLPRSDLLFGHLLKTFLIPNF
jgi:hypothetical protein